MLFRKKLPLDIQGALRCDEYSALILLREDFEIAGKELFLVGGIVRDLLLDRPNHDVDLATNATPDEMLEIASKSIHFHVIETGKKHGTLTFYQPTFGASFEVTTYREDSDYSDHRHPNTVKFATSLEDDLKRRDLTINSFAYDMETDEVIAIDESYFSDLDLKIIRCVGDPRERFGEDALRMLRAIRFAAQLGFTLDLNTYNAIIDLAPTLVYISMERIRDELTKIILSNHLEAFDFIRVTKLCDYLGSNRLPLQELLNSRQINKYHYTDVFHHTLDVMKYCPSDFELRWAAFFHDFGKLDTETIDVEGYMHYKGHPDYSAEYVLKYADAFKFTNEQRDNIYKLVKYHDHELKDIKMSHFKKLVNAIGIDLFPKFLQLRYADAMAHKLYIDNDFYVASVGKAKERFAKILKDKDALTVQDLKINGYDLIKLGYKGKEIGDQLKALLEIVLENPDANAHDYLVSVSSEVKKASDIL